ncbi:MAG: DUF2064 domain-containing protein [Bdellovibrionales bacterium]|nr:DUF2064 domain-containing protein [Bdellovibrionales bacterium]
MKRNSSSNSSGALAIFVKTPELSPVKTRLAASIGREKALQFYEYTLAATAALGRELQRRIPDLQIYWAVAEPEGHKAKRWASFPVVHQGSGELGARLGFVYESLLMSHSYVCFVGADSPHLEIEALLEGVRLTKKHSEKKFVMGETLDGGFYFFGGSLSVLSSAWQNVEYSTSKTAFQLIQNLTGFGEVDLIGENFDIDTIDDLIRLAEIFPTSEALLPEQLELIQWSKSLF